MIRVRSLTKQFGGEVAVRDLTFEIPRGTIFGFIGPSGSGKTTTIRLLTGVYAPSAGEVTVFDRPPSHFTRRQREKIGYMAQQFNLFPDLTVWENLNFSASLYGLSFFRGKRLKKLLKFVELEDHQHKLARNLSGGMQRRLNLAATLVSNPELIFLDEPTGGLDPILRQKVWDNFRELRDEGRTLFVTTQYMGEAAYCDLIGILAEHQLLRIDTPKGLRHAAFGGDVVTLIAESNLDYQQLEALRGLPYVRSVTRMDGDRTARLVVDNAGKAGPALVEWGQAHAITVKTVEEYLPPFDDVFVELIRQAPEV